MQQGPSIELEGSLVTSLHKQQCCVACQVSCDKICIWAKTVNMQGLCGLLLILQKLSAVIGLSLASWDTVTCRQQLILIYAFSCWSHFKYWHVKLLPCLFARQTQWSITLILSGVTHIQWSRLSKAFTYLVHNDFAIDIHLTICILVL